MTRLIIWRHGRTEWNYTGRFQGQTDVDLDAAGVIQAEEAASTVAAYQPDLIVSSDLSRATRTAEALADVTGMPVTLDPRLRERDYGPWQGLTRAEIRERYPDDFAHWAFADAVSIPGIETLDDMAKRVNAAFREAAERVGENGTAVLVTHGGAGRVGIASLLGWPPEIWPTLGVLGNCHLSEVAHTPSRGWRLASHNVA